MEYNRIEQFELWLARHIVRVLAVAVILFVSFTGIPIFQNEVKAADGDWTIAFNPTGTHFQNNYLKIRLDIYPPEGTKAYEVHYVEHFNEKDESLGWWLNPALNHFITVPRDITIEQLDNYITKLDTDFLATLDGIWEGYQQDTLIKPVADHISPLMRDFIYSTIKPDITPPILQDYYIEQVNTCFADYAVINDGTGGVARVIKPQSIDVGADAIDRGTDYNCYGYLLFSNYNPANADGTIDTVEVWLGSASNQLDVGTVYASSDWSSRDYEDVGACASGSMQQFTGLDIDILTGDYIGLNSPGDYAAVERDDVEGSSYYRCSGVTFPFTDIEVSPDADRWISLYGTGEEAGGPSAPTVVTNNPNLVLETTANLSGNITATGGENPGWAGFFYDDDGTPYANTQGSSGNYSVGEFTQNVTGLSYGTKYHYIASANNTGGTGNGTEITFITLPKGPADISSPETGNSTANLTWTSIASGGVDRYEVRRAEGATAPTDNTSGTCVYNSTGNATQDTGLTPGTQYSYSLFTIAEDDSLESCSDNYSSVTIWTHPGDVYGVSVSNVTSTQFQLDWTQGLNSENTTWRYQEGSYPADPASGNLGYNGTGTSCNITGLDPDTLYYVAGWGYDTDSGYWSINAYTLNQTTSGNITVATVTTNDATDVEKTTANVSGTITNTGGENCSRVAVQYDTDSGVPYSSNMTSDGDYGTVTFYFSLSSLTKGELYYYRTGANNTAGWGWGSEKTFLTKPDPATSFVSTDNGTSWIALSWTNGDGMDYVDVRYAEGDTAPSDNVSGTLGYWGNDTSCNVTGLDPGTQYSFIIFTHASEGGLWSTADGNPTCSDNTDIAAPTVTNSGATSVTYNTATLNGVITEDGGTSCNITYFWDTTDYGETTSWTYSYDATGQTEGSISHGITSLSQNTQYFYIIRITNEAGTGWSATSNFTTLTAPAPVSGGGVPVTPEETAVTGSTEIPQLLLILPIAACSIFAFWKENAILFYIAFGLSTMTGLFGPDIAEGDTTTMGLAVGLLFIAYAFVCFAFGMKITFWRSD